MIWCLYFVVFPLYGLLINCAHCFYPLSIGYFLSAFSEFSFPCSFLSFCSYVVCSQQRKFLPAEDIQLSKFLLSVIAGSQSAIFPSSSSIIRHGYTAEIVKNVTKCNSLWDVQAVAFDLLSQAITSLGSYFPVDVWKSTIQVETILLHL